MRRAPAPGWRHHDTHRTRSGRDPECPRAGLNRPAGGGGRRGRAVAALIIALSAVHLLPSLRNPFAESTSVRSQPVLLKSITALSRYQAASGSFQVVVDLTKKTAYLPSFLEGSQTLFVGQGSEIAYVNFAQLKSPAIKVSADRRAVTIRLPRAQLEPAVLNVRQSYVFAQQQGLLNRIGNFFAGNPNSEQQVYILAQQKIEPRPGGARCWPRRSTTPSACSPGCCTRWVSSASR